MPDKVSKYQRRNEKRRQLAFNVLGRRCVRCGSTDKLEFDHKNPAKKKNKLSRFWSAPKDEFIKELLKCQVLCAKCHVEKTNEDRKVVPKRHGTPTMYQKEGCRCKKCKLAMSQRKAYYEGRRDRDFDIEEE